MNIELPILHINNDYILPVSKKEYGICGLNKSEEFYKKARFIDINGQEWIIKDVKVIAFSSWWRIIKRKQEKVSFSLKKGRTYSFSELSNEIYIFLLNKQLKGSPFVNKAKEVPEYISLFKTTEDLITKLDYFDARN